MNLRAAVVAVLLVSIGACARTVPRAVTSPAATINLDEFWEEPGDLATRDLFHGTGGPESAPDPSASYTFVAADSGGYSPGFDVRGPDGREWSVKMGPEAQPEVVSSRVLWAIGFHQPPVYYLPRWTMVGTQAGPQPAARFRLDHPDHEVIGDWSWYENEFVGTQPFKGLVVVNVLLNNWDWKTSNNKIYRVKGDDASPARRFMVRDLGASLGKTSFPKFLSWFPMRGFGQGSRNDIDGFEEQGFIKRAKGDEVEFYYRGIHASVLKTISRSDVLWTSRLLAQLSDAQWNDAFRAAGYDAAQTERYVKKIKVKVAEGLALGSTTAAE